MQQLNGWQTDDDYALIQKEFSFPNYSDAMVFANKVAEIAEDENHHPDMCISYGSVLVMLTTHDVGGLSEKDFSVAKKIDSISV